jgi:hypothetical protein
VSAAIGNLAADLMERLDDTSSLAEGETAEVGVVAVVAEVTVHEPGGPGRTHVTYRCSDPRHWIQAGLFEQAKRATQGGPIDE